MTESSAHGKLRSEYSEDIFVSAFLAALWPLMVTGFKSQLCDLLAEEPWKNNFFLPGSVSHQNIYG